MFRHTSLALLLLALIGASSLSQTTLNVPTQYKTIQAAIDAAKTGDTVLVAPGTYLENIDFKGKAIHVRSSQGPELTTINGLGKTVVTLKSNETLSSILEGFTIAGGGRGVEAINSGPLIVGNIIRFNSIRSATNASGAGVTCLSTSTNPGAVIGNTVEFNVVAFPSNPPLSYSAGGGGLDCSHAVIMGNVIRGNRVTVPFIGGTYSSYFVGGGILANSSIISNNLIVDNAVHDTNAGPNYRTILQGGGIYCTDCMVVGNTIVNNQLSKNLLQVGVCGGIKANGATELVNNIIRGNQASSDPQVNSEAPARFCNIENGPTGNGNIDIDPAFVSDGSHHLRYDSPCRNAGTLALNVSASDFEWDDRGYGGKADIGADEFSPHVYHTGNAAPASTIHVTATGTPGSPCLLGWAATTVTPAIQLPGCGTLHLDPASLVVLPLGKFPASGVLSVAVPLPWSTPVGTLIPVQALVGTRLTGLHRIVVSP